MVCANGIHMQSARIQQGAQQNKPACHMHRKCRMLERMPELLSRGGVGVDHATPFEKVGAYSTTMSLIYRPTHDANEPRPQPKIYSSMLKVPQEHAGLLHVKQSS